MALVTHRDPQVVADALARWTEARTGAGTVRVLNAEHPSIGYSSETVLVDLAWADEGDPRGEHAREFVVRLAPPTVGTFRDYDLGQQTTAQLAAAAAGVPIASPELVDRTRVAGRAVRRDAARPRAHHRRGRGDRPVAPVAPRAAACAGARVVHRRRCRDAPGRSRRRGGRSGTRRRRPSSTSGRTTSTGRAAARPWRRSSTGSRWCRAHQPAVASEPVLLWGDVRLGNVIYGEDCTPRAVLDWDMASVGSPEHDVAWFTSIQTTTRTLLGQDLDGFPDRDGTVAQYESLSGRRLHDMAWYEIVAMIRSTAILARIGYLHEAAGQPNPMPLDGQPAPRPARGAVSTRIRAEAKPAGTNRGVTVRMRNRRAGLAALAGTAAVVLIAAGVAMFAGSSSDDGRTCRRGHTPVVVHDALRRARACPSRRARRSRCRRRPNRSRLRRRRGR